MEDNYTNELVQVNDRGTHQIVEMSDETTIQLMQNFANMAIGLAQRIAEDNEAKYKAQVEIMVANIQAKMQEEFHDINVYYNNREKQEEHIDKIITNYQESFKKLTDALISEENEKKVEGIKYALELLSKDVGNNLDRMAKMIESEQHTRLELLRSRARGLFDFFRRR